MKVVFIVPKDNDQHSPLSQFTQCRLFPPVGLARMAGMVGKHGSVFVIDERTESAQHEPQAHVATSGCCTAREMGASSTNLPLRRLHLEPNNSSTIPATRAAVSCTACCPASFRRRRPQGRPSPRLAMTSVTTMPAAGLPECSSVARAAQRSSQPSMAIVG